eukprot:GDKK01065809.1.p1 GENE.GDKK01065809.1~~GDKK01065809.1.p1  ORF type:complete len:249 (-),score=55.20 GDKK01065809.1:723-1469(-)
MGHVSKNEWAILKGLAKQLMFVKFCIENNMCEDEEDLDEEDLDAHHEEWLSRCVVRQSCPQLQENDTTNFSEGYVSCKGIQSPDQTGEQCRILSEHHREVVALLPSSSSSKRVKADEATRKEAGGSDDCTLERDVLSPSKRIPSSCESVIRSDQQEKVRASPSLHKHSSNLLNPPQSSLLLAPPAVQSNRLAGSVCSQVSEGNLPVELTSPFMTVLDPLSSELHAHDGDTCTIRVDEEFLIEPCIHNP